MKLTKDQLTFLRTKQYLRKGETIEQRIDSIMIVVKSYEKQYGEEGLSDRLREWVSKKYISLSTPQLANVGREKEEGAKTQPLPCSCNIIGVDNSIDSIYKGMHEAAMLSKLGGGVGANFLKVSDGGTLLEENFKTNSKLDWVEDYVRSGQKVSQNAVRRGYVAPYDSIESNQFWDYMERLDKNNPDKKDPLVNNTFGLILPAGFWQRFKKDKELQKRYLYVMQQRRLIGRIYILDVDNCNKNQSPVYKILNHLVDSSNICTEAITPNYTDKTFACMLLSLNLKYWDIIKTNPQIIRDAYILLDIFVQLYIDLGKDIPAIERAIRSAEEKRDIGLGTLGFHDYLQSKMIAFGGLESRWVNKEIYSTIREVGEKYTKDFGERLGSPKLCQEAGLVRRNVSLMMVAPNKSTSFFMDTSEGINPWFNNYGELKLAGVEATFKNWHLEALLESKGKNTVDVWESILENLGSVQHLDFLSDHEKAVFKTAPEISPKDIIDLASDRQKFIDMGQSINLWFRPNYTDQDVYNIHKYAWSKDIKTLYYAFPQSHATIEVDGKDWDDCESCAD